MKQKKGRLFMKLDDLILNIRVIDNIVMIIMMYFNFFVLTGYLILGWFNRDCLFIPLIIGIFYLVFHIIINYIITVDIYD